MQLKILKLLAAFFVVNSAFIFVFPLIIQQLQIFPLSYSLESIFRQIALIILGIILVKLAGIIRSIFDKAADEGDGTMQYKKHVQGFVLALSLYEMIVILAMLSLIIWSDFISYLFLGMLGLSSLIKEVIKISRLDNH